MNMLQLIYTSRPFGFDSAILNSILVTARTNNKKNDITGALICRADMYLQLLEGPKDEVNKIYETIKEDDRHLEVCLRSSSMVKERLFGAWAMRHDPAASWMWSQSEINMGAIENARKEDILAVFIRMSKDTE